MYFRTCFFKGSPVPFNSFFLQSSPSLLLTLCDSRSSIDEAQQITKILLHFVYFLALPDNRIMV